MRALRFRLVIAVLTALLLVLLAAPASADPGRVPHNGGRVGWVITTDAGPDEGGPPVP